MTLPTVTFDSISLTNPAPLKPRVSGTSGSEDSWEITIECFTETIADITNLQAKSKGRANKTLLHSGKTSVQCLGTKGSLVIVGGDLAGTYTNCYIDGDIIIEEQAGTGGGLWKYTVNFVKDCAA